MDECNGCILLLRAVSAGLEGEFQDGGSSTLTKIGLFDLKSLKL